MSKQILYSYPFLIPYPYLIIPIPLSLSIYPYPFVPIHLSLSLYPYPFIPIPLSLSFYPYTFIPIPLSLSLYIILFQLDQIFYITCKYYVNIEREREREREFIKGDVVIIQTHSDNTAVLGQKFTIHILKYTVNNSSNSL